MKDAQHFFSFFTNHILLIIYKYLKVYFPMEFVAKYNPHIFRQILDLLSTKGVTEISQSCCVSLTTSLAVIFLLTLHEFSV